jgi:hypothetical protein
MTAEITRAIRMTLLTYLMNEFENSVFFVNIANRSVDKMFHNSLTAEILQRNGCLVSVCHVNIQLKRLPNYVLQRNCVSSLYSVI